MSRLILLLIFAVWMLGSTSNAPPAWNGTLGMSIFLGGYAALVLAVAFWARLLTRRVGSIDLHIALNRFNRVLTAARAIIPAWLAFAIFGPVGWNSWVNHLLGPLGSLQIGHAFQDGALRLTLPGLLLGTLPAVAAWIGLWWAQYPAETALREQTLLDQLDSGLPVHAPPRLTEFLITNFRQQILFILLPILLILLVRDVIFLAVALTPWHIANQDDLETWIMLPAMAMVFVLAPELMRLVLNTRPLPDSPLRRRLESICQRIGLRYREILLWQTQYHMGNAAVMGLVPRLRYVLMSDLLLESLTDEQIEAVFAHEVGHIVHKHMIWYVVFFSILSLAALGPGWYLDHWVAQHLSSPAAAAPLSAVTRGFWELEAWTSRSEPVRDALGGAIALAGTLLIFGFISRRFERQADVFAARMIETNWGMPRAEAAIPSSAGHRNSHVGEHGAAVFTSSLRRVAAINNIPIEGRSWCHGSIASRIEYLYDLSSDPKLTGNFDRFMSLLYATLLLALMICGAIAIAGR